MRADDLRKTMRYRQFIFWSLAFGYVLVFFHRLCPAVVATDMMTDLHAGGALIGFLSSAYFYPYALMQLPTGLLSDSWGPRKTITLFLCVASIGSILLGLTPSPAGAIFGRVLVGLGVSTLFVCTLKILAEWFSVREFVFMTGILMAMGGVGSLSAATPMAVMSSWIGWRLSFVLVGLATALIAALIWRVVRDRPADLGWPSPAEHTAETEPRVRLRDGIRQVLTRPAFWPLAIWFFCKYGIFIAFAGLWGGPYLMHVYGVTKARAGGILSLVAVGMIVGSPLVGHLSNRVLKGRKPTLILASVVIVGITALLAFATEELSLAVIGLICFGLGVFASAIAVVGFASARELFPARISGTCFGLLNLFPFAGGAVMQPLLGAVLESHGRVGQAFSVAGYRGAFFVLFLSALAAFVASLFMQETIGRQG
ncbi:MAG: MFS transporter [Geobacteraceae bacterium]|nr:MFS transporter [Geobacteraceae bacterium]